MFVNNELDDAIYRGYNPAFVRRVWARRKEQEQAEKRRRAEQEARDKQRELKRKAAAAAARLAKLEADREERLAATMKKNSVMARDIAQACAASHGYLWPDIIGSSRSRHVVQVRQQCIRAVADARPDMSLPQIGRVFHRDHTTILHALRKTKKEGQVR